MSTVGDIVKSREVFNVQRDQSVSEAAALMAAKDVGAVAVLEGDRLVGIFTERDLMKRVVAQNRSPEHIKVDEVMTRELLAAHPNESHDSCLAKMRAHSVRHLVVADEKQLAGLISLRDLMMVDIEAKNAEIAMLDSHLQYTHMPQG
jgi:CBS domain-containing protein